MKGLTNEQMNLVFVVGGVALAYLAYKGVKEGADAVVSAVNPASPDNIVNKGVSKGIETASGGKFLSLGDFLFTLFNPNAPGERRITQYGVTGPSDI